MQIPITKIISGLTIQEKDNDGLIIRNIYVSEYNFSECHKPGGGVHINKSLCYDMSTTVEVALGGK